MVGNNAVGNADYLGHEELAEHSKTCDDPTPVKDAAEAECCKCRLTTVELKARTPAKPCRDQVKDRIKGGDTMKEVFKNVDPGHAFLWFPDISKGAGFTGQSRNFVDISGFKPGRVDYVKAGEYPEAKVAGTYQLCPVTRKKLSAAITKSKNAPPNYSATDKTLGGAAQCATWALDMLNSAGIPAEIPATGAEPWDLTQCVEPKPPGNPGAQP